VILKRVSTEVLLLSPLTDRSEVAEQRQGVDSWADGVSLGDAKGFASLVIYFGHAQLVVKMRLILL